MSGFLRGKYTLALEGIERVKNEVATYIRSRNHIRHFEPLTYMHRSVYQIMGLEFGYYLGRY